MKVQKNMHKNFITTLWVSIWLVAIMFALWKLLSAFQKWSAICNWFSYSTYGAQIVICGMQKNVFNIKMQRASPKYALIPFLAKLEGQVSKKKPAPIAKHKIDI